MKRLLLSLFLLAVLNTSAQGMDVEVSVSHFRPTLTGKYVAGHLMDNNATTVWASSALNNGVGSWFEVEFPEVITLRDMTIFNGHHGGEFQDFARIKAGRLVFSDGSEQHFELEDGAAARVVHVWQVPTRSLRVEVDAIYPEQPGKSMSLAVAELKFTAVKGDGVPRAMPEGGMLGELSRIIRDFYAKQTTLDDGFLRYFPEAKQREEAFGFEVFKQMQMQLGTYDDLRMAVVDTEDMKFRLMKFEDGAAEVHSFGHYSLAVGDKMIGIPDDSVFTLRKEAGEWKIYDIRDYAAF